jgi:hypothetical protein
MPAHTMKLKLLTYVLCIPAFFTGSFKLSAQDTVPDCQQSRYRAITDQAVHVSQASILRSDTIDILNYSLSLNITDFVSDTIRGNAFITFHPKMNGVRSISLDLLHFKIDSVKLGSISLQYTYNDTLLISLFPSSLQSTDTTSIGVFYHGKPLTDASGLGGFYFQSGYAYNLGVGISANPHNFGRAWYPCFDNFVERATYVFAISTNGGKIAYCNGLLQKDTTDALGLRTRTWVQHKTMPSYLASVAIAQYVQVNMLFNSLSGPMPVILNTLASDTVNLKSSFLHLPNAFAGFETRYGPYRWDRVGYSLVPFTGGAMEHATNIAYPLLAANGSLTYEASIMAHELSHHWFGDLVTCSSEGDMWLNEGWATYSQSIFTENVYGAAAYLKAVRANHENVLHYANWKEGGFLSVSGVPHAYTYGDHVYLKGADVAHTLRSYLGDSLFFSSLHYHLSKSAFSAVSSIDFRDNLIAASGQNNLLNFFNDWVFSPGWPHFSIDSMQILPVSGSYRIRVFIRQRLHGAPHYYTGVPLEITFKNSIWQSQTISTSVSGAQTVVSCTLPFKPDYAGLNLASGISDAITSDAQVLKSTAAVFNTTSNGRMQVTPTNAAISSDSAWIRVEHHYVAPDAIKAAGQRMLISMEHYWSVDGIFPPTFTAKALISYDGRSTILSGGSGCEDNMLLSSNNLEDSIVLLFRDSPAQDWQQEPNIVKTMGSLTDRYGTISILNLRKGEYALALKGFTTGMADPKKENAALRVYPNPSADGFYVEAGGAEYSKRVVRISDSRGRLISEEQVSGPLFHIASSSWAPGMYFLSLYEGDLPLGHAKLLVK